MIFLIDKQAVNQFQLFNQLIIDVKLL